MQQYQLTPLPEPLPFARWRSDLATVALLTGAAFTASQALLLADDLRALIARSDAPECFPSRQLLPAAFVYFTSWANFRAAPTAPATCLQLWHAALRRVTESRFAVGQARRQANLARTLLAAAGPASEHSGATWEPRGSRA